MHMNEYQSKCSHSNTMIACKLMKIKIEPLQNNTLHRNIYAQKD